MKKEDIERAQKALERQERRYKKQNEYIKDKYDRVSVILPKGTKERIQSFSGSVNSFIADSVIEKLERLEGLKK